MSFSSPPSHGKIVEQKATGLGERKSEETKQNSNHLDSALKILLVKEKLDEYMFRHSLFVNQIAHSKFVVSWHIAIREWNDLRLASLGQFGF